MSPWEEWDRKVTWGNDREKHELANLAGASMVPIISFILAVIAVAVAA